MYDIILCRGVIMDGNKAITKRDEDFAKWYTDHPFMPTTEKPTLRLKAYRLINLDIPAREQVSNAKDCRKYSADALRLARWWLDQPLDTNS